LEELEVYKTLTTPALPQDLTFSWPSSSNHDHKVHWMCFFSPSGVQAVNAELSKGKSNSINTLHDDDGPPSHLPLIAAIGPPVEQIFGKPPDAAALNPQPHPLRPSKQLLPNGATVIKGRQP